MAISAGLSAHIEHEHSGIRSGAVLDFMDYQVARDISMANLRVLAAMGSHDRADYEKMAEALHKKREAFVGYYPHLGVSDGGEEPSEDDGIAALVEKFKLYSESVLKGAQHGGDTQEK
jgi:hypothetical protein